MSKVILSASEVRQLISENKYKVNPKTKFISRCIDGRYQIEQDLPALALAGADAGQMAVIFATANLYGLKVDEEKVFKTVCEAVLKTFDSIPTNTPTQRLSWTAADT